MEASLLKLQQMRKTKQAGNDGKMTDDEKIRKQIRLDVTEFGERFFKLGVDRQNQAYKDLFLLANSTWRTIFSDVSWSSNNLDAALIMALNKDKNVGEDTFIMEFGFHDKDTAAYNWVGSKP